MDNIKVWVMNNRGRPLYIEKREADRLISQGKAKQINFEPKETYYPNFDVVGGVANKQAFEKIGQEGEVLKVEVL